MWPVELLVKMLITLEPRLHLAQILNTFFFFFFFFSFFFLYFFHFLCLFIIIFLLFFLNTYVV